MRFRALKLDMYWRTRFHHVRSSWYEQIFPDPIVIRMCALQNSLAEPKKFEVYYYFFFFLRKKLQPQFHPHNLKKMIIYLKARCTRSVLLTIIMKLSQYIDRVDVDMFNILRTMFKK